MIKRFEYKTNLIVWGQAEERGWKTKKDKKK